MRAYVRAYVCACEMSLLHIASRFNLETLYLIRDFSQQSFIDAKPKVDSVLLSFFVVM